VTRFRKILARLDHWKQALMGPVVGIPILLYQQLSGKTPSWGWFVALVLGGLAWQYHTEYKRVKKEVKLETPKLFLVHIDPKNDIERFTNKSGFFVEVEGPKKAFSVKIVSPDAVGRDHTRLEML
jgi:hypothetical protein